MKYWWKYSSDSNQKTISSYLLNSKPPGAAQPFVPVQSDTAVQAKLHRDSGGQPPSGCSGPSCYWCPEGLGTVHDPQDSHPDTPFNHWVHWSQHGGSSFLCQLWLKHFTFAFIVCQKMLQINIHDMQWTQRFTLLHFQFSNLEKIT